MTSYHTEDGIDAANEIVGLAEKYDDGVMPEVVAAGLRDAVSVYNHADTYGATEEGKEAALETARKSIEAVIMAVRDSEDSDMEDLGKVKSARKHLIEEPAEEFSIQEALGD